LPMCFATDFIVAGLPGSCAIHVWVRRGLQVRVYTMHTTGMHGQLIIHILHDHMRIRTIFCECVGGYC
jgi:hypothetical protein